MPGSTSRRDDLRRSYLALGLGELAAAVTFALVVAVQLSGRPHSTRTVIWAALVPLLVVLVQAGGYWLAARSWVHRGSMPAGIAAVYRAFRVGDVVLLAASLVIAVGSADASPATKVFAIGIWLFAVIEYVNYFWVRLAYPWRVWLREVGRWHTPRLVQDMNKRSG